MFTSSTSSLDYLKGWLIAISRCELDINKQRRRTQNNLSTIVAACLSLARVLGLAAQTYTDKQAIFPAFSHLA